MLNEADLGAWIITSVVATLHRRNLTARRKDIITPKRMLAENPYGLGEDLVRYIAKRTAYMEENMDILKRARRSGNILEILNLLLTKYKHWKDAKFYQEANKFFRELRDIYHDLNKGGPKAEAAAKRLEELRKREKDLVVPLPKGMDPWDKVKRPPPAKISSNTTVPVPFTDPSLAQQVKALVNQEFELASAVVNAVALQAPANPTEAPKELLIIKEPEPNQPPPKDLDVPKETKLEKLPNGQITLAANEPPFNDITLDPFDLSVPIHLHETSFA
jgi:hypothetical protein